MWPWWVMIPIEDLNDVTLAIENTDEDDEGDKDDEEDEGDGGDGGTQPTRWGGVTR